MCLQWDKQLHHILMLEGIRTNSLFYSLTRSINANISQIGHKTGMTVMDD
jgi:hypothetical protein